MAVKMVTENRQARFNFEIFKTFTAGMALLGTEVKALREGRVRLDSSYGRVIEGQVYLYDAYIGEYSHGNLNNHDPDRRRRLLLHKREIVKIGNVLKQKGLTLVPLNIFFNERNLAKITVGIGRGKSKRDKRDTIRQREADRQIRGLIGR
ncbi:SsrA-binding protein SmpB [Planctomycetota bacterium]